MVDVAVERGVERDAAPEAERRRARQPRVRVVREVRGVVLRRAPGFPGRVRAGFPAPVVVRPAVALRDYGGGICGDDGRGPRERGGRRAHGAAFEARVGAVRRVVHRPAGAREVDRVGGRQDGAVGQLAT